MHKDKSITREKIISAVGKILITSGMREIGINSIARQAGVDKVLIYRYFGSLEELLRAFVQETNLWPTSAELLGEKAVIRRTSDIRDVISSLLINQLAEIRRRKPTQEILRWEIIEENELTQSLAAARAKQVSDIVSGFYLTQQPSKDIEALLALINAGITYLVLRSKIADKHLGIDLHSNYGWQRLSKLINELVTDYLNNADENVTK
jgi:AcrR family transcriptional regulator